MSEIEKTRDELFAEFAELKNKQASHEQLVDVSAEEVNKEPEKQVERIFTDAEQEAIKAGWNPDGPRDAETYMLIGSFKDEVSARGKKIKQLEDRLSKAERRGYERALTELQAQRHEAIEYGDVEAVEKFDQLMTEVKQELHSLPKEEIQDTEARNAELNKDFLAKNQDVFISTSPDYVAIREAVILYDSYLKASETSSPEEHFTKLQEMVDKKLHEMHNKVETKPQAVESSSYVKPASKAELDYLPVSEMDQFQLNCYNYYLNYGSKEKAKQFQKDLWREKQNAR